MTSETVSGIYLGSRGDDFKELIIGILKKYGKLKSKYVNMLTDDEAMKVYSSAFTSELVDPENNYQVLEQLGDLAGNKIIVNYMYEKFPQLDCAEGVKVVARLRINYGAKQSFSEISRKLGFWNFISATNDLRQRKMKPLLEDVFEAFLGATERILDRRKRVGVGYAIVYDILASIFDEMDISLNYEDLYDSKTRLKELFDINESSLGPGPIYKERKSDLITFSEVYRVAGGKYEEKPDGTINKKKIIGGKYIKIGEGSAALKADAQQNAASASLATLAKQGWFKPVPKIYQKFRVDRSQYADDSKEEIIDSDSIKKTWGTDMNALQSTKGKTKYQSKYQSTPLAGYCSSRNLVGVVECLKLGADPNIKDTDDMFATDLLFIGKNESSVQTILKKLFKYSKENLKMHRPVFEMYYTKYIEDYFGEVIGKLDLVD